MALLIQRALEKTVEPIFPEVQTFFYNFISFRSF